MKYKECKVFYRLKVYYCVLYIPGIIHIIFTYKNNNLSISKLASGTININNINEEVLNNFKKGLYSDQNTSIFDIYFEQSFLELINATKQNQDKLNQVLIWEILQQKIKEKQ